MALKRANTDFLLDGSITATTHVTQGGLVSEFVKGDGSLDSSVYSQTGHTHALSGLTDTNIGVPSDGEVLTWDNTSQKWIASGSTGGSGGSGLQSLSFSADTGDLEITSGNTVNLDGRYSLTGHTHPGVGSWVVITGNTSAVENTKYITDSGSIITLTLPTTNNLETIRVSGRGVGGWQVDIPSGWTITFVDEVITDNIQSTATSDSVELLCTGDSAYQVISSTGNIIFNNL